MWTMTIKSGLGEDLLASRALPGSGCEGGPDLSRESSGPAPAPIHIGRGTEGAQTRRTIKWGDSPSPATGSCPRPLNTPGLGESRQGRGRAGLATGDSRHGLLWRHEKERARTNGLRGLITGPG